MEDIQKYQASYSDMEKMASAIAKSQLFGLKTVDQVLAIMLVCQAEGLHPAIAARDYDIIQGRPALKSKAKLARFQKAGGIVKWITRNDTDCSAEFSHPASPKPVVISWDFKRANAAGLGAKDMWKKYPRQMLSARVISEGVDAVYPDAGGLMYVPEEVEDFVEIKEPENKITLDTSVAQLANRNYTEEAQQCQTIEELKAWYTSLNSEEKGNLVSLKNFRKKEIEDSLKPIPSLPAVEITNGHQGEDASEAITKLIKALNEKSWGPELAEIEKLLDEMPLDMRNEYKELFSDKINKLGLKTDCEPLPFWWTL